MTGVARVAGAGRLHHLDALRGLAAFAVVLHHAFLSLPVGDPLLKIVHALGLLRIVELGRPAVVLFFVLSGFVLALCMEPGRDTFLGFASRRALRLLPPYWAAIVLSFALYSIVPRHHAGGLSQWLVSQWEAPISAGDIVRHLAMLAGPHQYPLDHVAWSLVHELRLSLVVPLLVLVAARYGTTACLALAGGASLGASVLVALRSDLFPTFFHGYHFDGEGLLPSLVLGTCYVVLFAVGVAMARRRAAIADWLARRRATVMAGLVVSFALLSQSNEAAMALGAAGLVAIVACSAACARALAFAPLVWLGRTSYSLYLVHVPVMLACGFLLGGTLAPRAILALAIVLALPMAEVMFRLVERPSIRLSRSVGRALSGGGAAPERVSTTPVIAEA